MTDNNHISNSFETSGVSPPQQGVAPPRPEPMSAEERKERRTTGLRLFDVLLYPILTNFAVFGISVGATYLTSKGHTTFKPGTFMDGFGQFMHTRGTKLQGFFQRFMPEKSAEMAKIVFFSFFDGTLIAPLVKIFEDRREKIGKWIDDRLGTTPNDLSVYEAEPKQTWGTVIAGRAVTVVPVVLTAVALDKAGLNDKLFRNPGIKMGEWIQRHPNIAKKFGKLDIPEISKVSIFEAFYTSVCTLGLYLSSRALAHNNDKKTGRLEEDPVTHRMTVKKKQSDAVAPTVPATPVARDDNEFATPTTQVAHVQAQARVQQPLAELATSA